MYLEIGFIFSSIFLLVSFGLFVINPTFIEDNIMDLDSLYEQIMYLIFATLIALAALYLYPLVILIIITLILKKVIWG